MSSVAMSSTCPYPHTSLSDEATPGVSDDVNAKCPVIQNLGAQETSKIPLEAANDGAAATCPFGHGSGARVDPSLKSSAQSGARSSNGGDVRGEGGAKGASCPLGHGADTSLSSEENRKEEADALRTSGKEDSDRDGESEGGGAKCPFGYGAGSSAFQIGPFSCVICKALLFDSCRCSPCRHVYCRGCISRFQDCPLCGADILSLNPDPQLQLSVDNFINGHGRIRRHKPEVEEEEEEEEERAVVYGGASVERGLFLLQHAMRAFQAGNLKSASCRLEVCLEDTRGELQVAQLEGGAEEGGLRPLHCQLATVLGLLGDCCRMVGDDDVAAGHYQEAADHLSAVEDKDAEVVHALSVSLNKLGDLLHYSRDLVEARSLYARALAVRRTAGEEAGRGSSTPAQVLDLAVSLAKVADVDRALGNEAGAREGFEEAKQMVEGMKEGETAGLEQRRVSTLSFLRAQFEEGDGDVPHVFIGS